MLWIANILPCSTTTYPWHTLDLQKLVRLKEEYRTANYAIKFSDHYFNSIVIPSYQVNAHSIDSEHFNKFERLKSKTLQYSKDPNKTIVKMHPFSSFVQRMSVWSRAKTIRTNPFNFAQQGLQSVESWIWIPSNSTFTQQISTNTEFPKDIIGRPSLEVQATLSQCPPGRENVKLPKSQRRVWQKIANAQGWRAHVKRRFWGETNGTNWHKPSGFLPKHKL